MVKPIFIPCLNYQEADKALQWLKEALGFEEKAVYRSDDGKITHAELLFKGNMIMMGSTDSGTPYSKLVKHPREIEGMVTQNPYVILDEEEIDGHYERAVAKGAQVVFPMEEKEYGGKSYSCYDLEGHLWSFGTYDPLK